MQLNNYRIHESLAAGQKVMNHRQEDVDESSKKIVEWQKKASSGTGNRTLGSAVLDLSGYESAKC